mgnify:FL=1
MDYREDYYRGIAGIYFRRVLRTIIQMGNLRKEPGLILDYGCGVGHLQKALPGKNVIGYDVIPELSEVKDYRKLKPSVIVCNAVLEHLTIEQLKGVIEDFKKMHRQALLVTALPTENILSKIGMVLTGYTEAHDDHKSTLREVNEYLLEHCTRLGRKMIFTMMEVSTWKFRDAQQTSGL